MDYLEQLNDEQKKAVLLTEGPLLILAGAGSGKTRVLTYRIAYMINDCYIRPSNILAITFTKKAAAEMKQRIAGLLGNVSVNMWIGTFHACCARILRMDIERLGYSKNFIIYDEDDSMNAIKESMKILNISDKDVAPRAARAVISRAKDALQSEKDFDRIYANDYQMNKISRIYFEYQNILKRNNALDFDDIIFQTVSLLEKNKDLLEKYSDKFKYIMVDEYQDTNPAQYKLVSLLSSRHSNLCVVGDDDQSIYSFRGADFKNIFNFEKEFPDAAVIKLEKNYRSTGNILNSANAVIKNNTMRKGKVLWTDKTDGDKVCRYEAENEHEEASFIAGEISKLVGSGKYKYSDIAVLYRINTLSRIMEETLMKSSIPYRIIGGHKFYDRKEIKDIISYLKLLENPDDTYALKRIINVPKRGIGDTTFNNITALSYQYNIPALDIIKNAGKYPELARSAVKLNNFASIMEDIINARDKDDLELSEIIKFIYNKTGMVRELEEEGTEESLGRIGNLEEFISVAVEFSENYEPETDEDFEEENKPMLMAFLESIALVTDLDSENGEENYVLLMTMHSSKGLEFPAVFLMGFEEGIFPGMKSMDTQSDMEEERRLCYVAITRASLRLYITNASQRMVYGSTQYSRQSRFIKELPGENIDNLNFSYGKKQRQRQWSFDGDDSNVNNNAKNTAGFGKRIDNAKDINSSFLASLNKGKKLGGTGPKPSSATAVPSSPLAASSSGAASLNPANPLNPVNPVNPCDWKQLKCGDKVVHKKFGEGIISKISGIDEETQVEVIFDISGMKRFMAQFAGLSKIDGCE